MANTIAISSGNNQAQGIVGDLLLPLKVIVTDTNAAPVQGVVVSFAVDSYPTGATGQAVGSATATTGADGTASVVATLGNVGGTYTFTATAAGLTGSPLTFTAYALAIVTLAQAKDYLHFTDTTNDAALSEFIGTVSQTIEGILFQPVCPRPIEDIIDGEGRTKVYLNKARIVDLLPDPITGNKLDSLQIRSSALGAWSQVVEDINLVYLNPINNWCVELLDYRIFAIGWKNIRVYFQGGFDPIPGDIIKMALEMVSIMWKESEQGGMSRLGFASQNRGAVGTSLGDSFKDMMTVWQPTIDRYKRLV